MPVILFALICVGILLFISGAYVFWAACVRHKDRNWLDFQSLKETPYERFYPFICETNDWLVDHHAQDVYIYSDDGLRLHGLWVPVPNAKGTVLFAHGYRSTILIEFHIAVVYFRTLGFNLLIPDQRCHGESEGKYITFGVKESTDMKRWIEYHNSHFGISPMILFGVSMGASTMLYLADQKLPANVCGIIADCGFTSPKAILSSVYRAVIHLPACLSLWVTEWFARVFAGFSLSEKDTRKVLPRSRYPVLMIHGAADSFVPCEMSRQGFDVCGAEKTLLTIPDADHGYSVVCAPDRYTEAVFQFIQKHVEGFA